MRIPIVVKRITFFVVVAWLSSAALFAAENWKPARPKLMTEWGEKVAPDNAWKEYPRPQLVRERWLNLNGLWDYAIAPKIGSQPAKFDGQILVPFAVESALSGVGKSFTPNDRLWYHRTFSLPKDWVDNRVLLHFGAVDYECVLWLNGGIIGAHKGGSDAFTFDITEFLKPGENEIQLAVTDPTDTGEQPRGKQQLDPKGIWYTPASGIWQTVWLEPVPKEDYLAEIRFTPDVANKRLLITPLSNTATERDDLAVRITAFAKGKNSGSTVARVNREGILNLNEVQLWSPESPFLYDLTAELVRVKPPVEKRTEKNNRGKLPSFGATERAAYAKLEAIGEPLDSVKSYFGMRNVSLGAGPKSQQPHLRLNDKAIFQHGPLDQGWWPDGLLTPPSDEAMIWEIKWLKSAGFNMLRKHIKVEPARYYYHCDQLGILVWQDMPSGFNKALRNYREDEGEPVRLSTSREQHELELRRMIDNLHNHPSIVMWVIHNEGWGQYESPALSRWVKSIDPSRWVNGITGWLDQNVSDIYDIHTYHEIPLAPANQADRAIVIGEYGGVGWPVTGHLWDAEKRNWGYQTYQTQEDYEKAIRKKIEGLRPMVRDLGLSAAVYTQTTDVEGEVNGFMTYDRKKIKIPAETLKEMNDKLIETK
jgi:beta-galactosidase/beta-glucuronidase